VLRHLGVNAAKPRYPWVFAELCMAEVPTALLRWTRTPPVLSTGHPDRSP